MPTKTASNAARFIRSADGRSYVTPFTVVIDTREQLPFSFAGIRTDAVQGRLPVAVQTVRYGLTSGDYSLAGFERQVALERKSLADLFSTLGQNRLRFQDELDRLQSYDLAAVVCEQDWEDVLLRPPERSQLRPKTVFRSVVAWQLRYPKVHWWFCPGRDFAEAVTFRLLERFWREWGPASQKDGEL